MRLLIRILPILLLLWLICYCFYSLGKNNAIKENKKKTNNYNHRKKVESKVVGEEKNE